MNVPIVGDLQELRRLTTKWHRAGETIGVVPTMGALHDGHLSLVKHAAKDCERVIVTLFVNPKQFNNPEDLANYPRTEHEDAAKLAPFNIDVLYVPSVETMYPDRFSTTVSVNGLTDMLCGEHRPGHFDGVATVVSKLLMQTSADRAYFGEKDYQQLQVVSRMARDLNLPTEIVGCPTIRERDGLAMSSRNARLTAEGRAKAPALHAALQELAVGLSRGGTMADLAPAVRRKITDAGFSELEYLDLRAADGLELLNAETEPARLFVAAWIDGVRLIDNFPV